MGAKEWAEQYGRDGYLLLQTFFTAEEVTRLQEWCEGLLQGKDLIIKNPEYDVPDLRVRPEGVIGRNHPVSAINKRSSTGAWLFSHPRVREVIEALIRPKVAEITSMLFYNPPGTGGVAWHQDASERDEVPIEIAAWIPIERADEENGCLWLAQGSGKEPIHPRYAVRSGADDETHPLWPVISRYPRISVPMEAGDLVLFSGRTFHRSHKSRSADRGRRAVVCFYGVETQSPESEVS